MHKLMSGKVSILVLTAAFAVASFLLGSFLTPAQAKADKVTICHATGSEANPYVQITAAYNAIYGQAGHFSEPGTPNEGHEDDYEGPCEGETEEIIYGCTDPDALNYEEDATDDDGSCEYPEETPTPSGEASPTPTPVSGDVCPNLEGYQTSIPDGYHKDTPWGTCNTFSNAGPPEVPYTPQGQVLGTSTMASTGSFLETLYLAIMGLGGAFTTKAVKGLKRAFKKA